MSYWTRDAAITLCEIIESICPEFGCHVALTGGTLYKQGVRKDCDVLFIGFGKFLKSIKTVYLPLLIVLESFEKVDSGGFIKPSFAG